MQTTIIEKAKKARIGLSLAATFSLILSLFSSVAYAENLVDLLLLFCVLDVFQGKLSNR